MFPAASVIVQVTVVVPSGYVAGALFVITKLLVQLSVANGKPKSTPVASQKLFEDTVTFAGASAVGAVWSTTVTNCVAVEVLPEASVTVQVTVVVPIG